MDDLYNNSVYVFPYAILITAILMVLGILIGRLRSSWGEQRSNVVSEEGEVELVAIVEDDGVPRCPCGSIATHPASRLVRERTDQRQAVYAMAPRYKRVVPRARWWRAEDKLPLELCAAHAHMSDAEMDHFIYTDIRAKQSELNQEIAVQAAAFETEVLLQRIRDNLTDEQKKKIRLMSSKRNQLKAVNGGGAPLSDGLEN